MVPSNSLEINKTYSLSYSDPWTGYDVGDVEIVSITNDSQSALFSQDSIFSLFFSAYNLGISSYVSLMNSVPDIYVCRQVKSRNPYALEPNGYVLIPKVVIDFSNTEELYQCDDITVNIAGLLSYFSLDYDRGVFNQKLIADIQNVVTNLSEYGNVPTSVTMSKNTILKTSDDYAAYDLLRTSSYDINQEAEILIQAQFQKQQRDNIDAYNNLQTQIASYNNMLTLVQEKINTLDQSINNYNQINTYIHNPLKGDVESMFNGLENGTIIVNSIGYTTLKNEITMFLNTSSLQSNINSLFTGLENSSIVINDITYTDLKERILSFLNPF